MVISRERMILVGDDANEVLGGCQPIDNDWSIDALVRAIVLKYGKDDLEWVHDFRAFLMVIHNFYIYRNSEGEEREYFDKKDRGCPLTYREILTKTHITDINSVMIFFDMYLGYIHSFIDTGIFNTIAAIEYEPVTSPHSGYYYKHMITLEKVDGVWQPKGEVPYIGTIPRQDNNIEGE